MVVLQIDGGGFCTAATAFAEANQLTALVYDSLTSVLAGCGGMAGEDTTSTDFVAAYDDAATEAVAALADLVEACTRVGHLTHATLTNHAAANTRAVIGGATLYDVGWLPDLGTDTGYVTVLPSTPPTSLGATTPGLSTKIDWILDHLEGFVWPGADLDRLRRAATAWRTAAQALGDVAGCCDSAARGFWREHSPEIPLAIEATTQLQAQVTELASCFAALAGACESYADAVEAKHREILDLSHWVLEQIVEGILISVALGFLTAGAGTAAGLGAVATKVAAQSPKFTALLDTLRVLAEGCAATARAAHDTATATRLRLLRFKNATIARSAAQGERGELKLIWSRGRLWKREDGWLDLHEKPPGHTLDRHVAKTDDYLIARTEKGTKTASSFTDQPTAEREISRVLDDSAEEISAWLKSPDDSALDLDGTASQLIGRCAVRGEGIFDAQGVHVVLLRNDSMPEGFHILTAYPTL